jgi:EpsD family peptidyl-prolyl cis-trans isomerase
MKSGPWLAALCATAVLLAGCDRGQQRPEAVLAARVNAIEISVEPRQPVSAADLEKIIDRELLVQRALEQKLERDPQVRRAIDEARRQILAQAYLERAAASRDQPSAEEIAAFYRDNPALFGERRIYRLRELVLEDGLEKLEALQAQAAEAGGLDQIALWLQARNARFQETSLLQPAEQLPLSTLAQVWRMKEGQIAVLASPHGATVLQLVQSQPAPLAEAQAAPLIEKFLAGRKRLELAAAEVRRLREAASIEYVGDFKAR